jgi:hypothetical protein
LVWVAHLPISVLSLTPSFCSESPLQIFVRAQSDAKTSTAVAMALETIAMSFLFPRLSGVLAREQTADIRTLNKRMDKCGGH